MASQLKAKAFFILLLLAGHEANRLENNVALNNALSPTQATPSDSEEKEWHKENHKCKWTRQQGCKASEGCASRYLPLDGLPPFSSEKCRLSDEHMLKNLPKYFPLQAQVLQATTMKFNKKCQSRLRWLNPKCLRLAKQVFRAMKFEAKAQDSDFIKEMTSEQIEEHKALVEQSLNNMNFGKDAQYVTMLKEKVQANREATRGNPIGLVKTTVGLLAMLLKGSHTERTLARKAIETMEEEVPDEFIEIEATPAGEPELDANKLKEMLEEGGMEPSAEDIEDASRGIDEDEPADASLEIDPASALIQQDAQVGDNLARVSSIAFIGLVWLILLTMLWGSVWPPLIVYFLLSLAWLALLGGPDGCPHAYVSPYVSKIPTEPEANKSLSIKKPFLKSASSVGKSVLTCIGQMFKTLFMAIPKGGKWVYRKTIGRVLRRGH